MAYATVDRTKYLEGLLEFFKMSRIDPKGASSRIFLRMKSLPVDWTVASTELNGAYA